MRLNPNHDCGNSPRQYDLKNRVEADKKSQHMVSLSRFPAYFQRLIY